MTKVKHNPLWLLSLLLLLQTVSYFGAKADSDADSDPTETPYFPHRYLGTIELPDSAFVYLNQFTPSDTVSLWITTFSGNPFQSDGIYFVDDFAAVVAKGDAAINATTPNSFTTEVTWPNQALAAPYDGE